MNGKPLWIDFLPEARAVFRAIRGPTERQCDAAMDVTNDHARSTWQSMIDAALEER